MLPHLLAMLDGERGGVDARIANALNVVVEQLGLESAYVSRFVLGQSRITHVAGTPLPAAALVPMDVPDTICRLVATGAIETLVLDTAVHPLLATHPHVETFAIGTYAGVPLVVDGDIVGAVCAIASTPSPELGDRDADRLATVGEFIGRVLTRAERRFDEANQRPGGPDETHVQHLAQVVAEGKDLESLTRPLLELMHTSTGLESTYLTFVDWAGDRQQIVHSFNTGRLAIPEGLSVPWGDTLCRRAMDAGTSYTRDVPRIWGDSEAARRLGIQTYVSVPITDADQGLIGTLCGASSASIDLNEQHLMTMQLFGLVLAEKISRDRAEHRQQERAHLLAQYTGPLRRKDSEDPLTGLPNRCGIHEWLSAVIPTLRPGAEQLALAFIDVDGFAELQGRYGPQAGDDVLRQIADALVTVARSHDLQGRLDGHQFVTAAVLAPNDAVFGEWSYQQRNAATVVHRPAEALSGDELPVTASVGVITVVDPGTDVDQALLVAEHAMERRKARLAV